MKIDKLSINNLVLIIVGETKKQTTPNKSGRELAAFLMSLDLEMFMIIKMGDYLIS